MLYKRERGTGVRPVEKVGNQGVLVGWRSRTRTWWGGHRSGGPDLAVAGRTEVVSEGHSSKRDGRRQAGR